MNFKLVTLLGIKVDKEVYEVIIPTSTGEIAVFPGHEPLVSLVVQGVAAMRYKKGDPDRELEYFAVTSGVAEISQKSVRILVNEADYADDIVESESKAALERAIKLRGETTDRVELDKAHQLVDRQLVRLKVAELRRHHRK